ncbi:MAG: cation transporter [Alphaproteobacteria bacterium]|nr:cation transporter [Alphaproteobacteria bacterium]
MSRHPSKEERAAERAVIAPIVADFGTSVLLLTVGIAAGSLTLIGEGIRSFLMLAASMYAAFVLYAIHHGRMSRFEFGPDKVERFATLVVGLGLVVSGVWIATGALATVTEPGPAVSSLWLVFAAITNAINAAVNIAGWFGMRAAMPRMPSDVFLAQMHARLTMMISSLFLQVTLTIAALAKDPALATGMDALGAAFVAVLMILRGATMLHSTLPHILDYHPDPTLSDRIECAARRVLPNARVVHLRTRPYGGGSQAEIRLAVEKDAPAARTAVWNKEMTDQLAAGGDNVHLALTVIVEPAR